MHKLAHPDGELATSRAAAKTGICMALSTYSTTSLEAVISQEQGNPYVFQMSLFENKDVTEKMLRRAESELPPFISQWSNIGIQLIETAQVLVTKPYFSQWMRLSLGRDSMSFATLLHRQGVQSSQT